MKTSHIHAAIRKSHDLGAQNMLRAVFSSLGRSVFSQTIAPIVVKAIDPSEESDTEDPHAALLLAQIDHLIDCRESGRDSAPGNRLLHDLWDSPSGLSHILQTALHGESVAVQKSVAFAIFLKAAERSPKGGISVQGVFFPGGQWIPSAVVSTASPEERQELTERNAGTRSNPPNKREQTAAAAESRRNTRAEVRKHVANIASDIMLRPNERTPDKYRDLAFAITKAVADNHLSINELRSIRLKLSASFGGQRRKAQMVAALLEHANLAAKELQDEADNPTPPEPPKPPKAPRAPKPGTFAVLPTGSLSIDPARFQFKLKTNELGVTKELENVKTFNPDFAGVIAVWHDPSDGKTYVINGHHRFELARRTNYPHLAVRYLEAKDAREARAKGALINIAEGRGTALDAAKFLRDSGRSPDDLYSHGISKNSALARDAETLTKLNDAAFERVARGSLLQATAIAVAKHLADPDRQEKLFKMIVKREEEGKDFTQRHLEEMARQMAHAPSATVKTESLFGDDTSEEDTFLERSDLAAHIRSELAKEHHDYGALSSERRAGATAEAGNVLNVGENKKRAESAEVNKHAFDTLAYRKGAVADVLDAGSVAIKTAKTKKEKENVRKQTVAAIRHALATAVTGQAANGSGVGTVVPGSDPGSGGEPETPTRDGTGATPEDGRGRDNIAPSLSRQSATSAALAPSAPTPPPHASWIPGVRPPRNKPTETEQDSVRLSPPNADDYQYSKPKSIGGGVHKIAATDPSTGKEIGHVEYSVDGSTVQINDVKVQSAHRRRKIATRLYENILAANPGTKIGQAMKSENGEQFRAWFDAQHPELVTGSRWNQPEKITPSITSDISVQHSSKENGAKDIAMGKGDHKAKKSKLPTGKPVGPGHHGHPGTGVSDLDFGTGRQQSHEAEQHAYAKQSAKEIATSPESTPEQRREATAAAETSAVPHDISATHANADHSAAIGGIAPGDSQFIAGHRVRHTKEGKFQAERRGGFLTSSDPHEISNHIRGAWEKQRGYKSIPKAIERAKGYAEPDPFTDSHAASLDAAARSALPEGTPAVSLDPNTYGRVGYVNRDPESGATWLALEGGEETRAQDFEPINESLSWRGETGAARKEAAKNFGGKKKKPKAASMFD